MNTILKNMRKTALILVFALVMGLVLSFYTNASATGISFVSPQREDDQDFSYVPKNIAIKSAKIDLVARKSAGPLYTSMSKQGGIYSYQNQEYYMLHVGEKNGFYICLTFDTMKAVYIPKSEGSVYKTSKVYFPARQEGTYEYINDDLSQTVEYSADGKTVSVSTTSIVEYFIGCNFKSLVYYIKKTGPAPLVIDVKNSIDFEDDGEFTLKNSATLLMDGTETVTIEGGEIISFFFTPKATIKNIIEKYSDRFEAPALIVVKYEKDFPILDDAALIFFD